MRPSQRYNIHPSTHGIDTLLEDTFDVICIGSGWAGRTLAVRMAKAGHSALIIENELFGGDCPFWACVPSKLMLYPSEARETAAAVGAARNKPLDAGPVLRRRDEFIFHRDDNKMITPALLAAGVTLVRGTGKLAGEKKVVISNGMTSKLVVARLAVAICSGSDPIIPESVRDVDPWTPRDASSATEIPAHLIIMGGGVVGCEFATAYASLGAQVTLISSSGCLLPGLDNEVGLLIAGALRGKNVNIVLGRRVVSASGSPDEVTVKLSDDSEIRGSVLLVAAGRRAVLDIGLETIGMQPTKTLPVDKSLLVSTPDNSAWLYAPGDANGIAPFTHAAKHHGSIVANAILKKGVQVSSDLMPQVIFTRPTVASVGLTAKAIKDTEHAFRVIQADYRTIASSIQGDEEPGFAQCILDQQNRIRGITLVGHLAGEVIHAGTTAIVAGLKLEDLVGVVPSFPTCSEVYLNLLEAAGY